MFVIIKWLLACFILTMLMKPLFSFETLRFWDAGYSVMSGLGMAVSFLGVWFICALSGLPFNSYSCISITLFISLLTVVLRFRTGHLKVRSTEEVRGERRRFIAGFLIFALLFLAAVWVKGFKPVIDFQTEQYMDYGFMKAMYRQQKVPFEDFWCAGKLVNYYYLGQAFAVFMCILASVPPEYGYNLMLCMVFALFASMIFSLVYAFLSGIGGMKRVNSIAGGAAAAVMCSCGGNGHWIVYGIIGQIRDRFSGIVPEKKYWFPDSTLFIGYDPETLDKAKHEFPSYTLVLGDLHAHVCNMLFTIPLLAVLFDYALSSDGNSMNSAGDGCEEGGKYVSYKELFSPHILICGVLLGLFRGVNYWDFPIYYTVAVIIILFADARRKGVKPPVLINVLFKGLIIYLTSTLAILPFTLDYSFPVSGVHLCDRHSPIRKLAVIWFVHVIIALSLVGYVLCSAGFRTKKEKTAYLTGHESVMIAVTLCGLGLLAVPEFIYVKDIYGDTFQRYNTMFKLTFQGFILLSIIAGICIGVFLSGKKQLKLTAVVYCTASLLLGAYMGWSVRAWFGNVFDVSRREGISICSGFGKRADPDDISEVIEILNADRDKNLHIIEAAGDSYRPENRLSVFTGASAVSGWYVHEWVWRNDSEDVHKRHDEVMDFYMMGSETYCRDMIRRYDIDYVYVGKTETEKYPVNYDGFKELGEHVWESSDGRYMLIKTDVR